MDIKADVSIPICIEQGSIYLYHINVTNHDGSLYDGDRFFIVLNLNPKTDETLILTTITKRVEKQKEFIKRIGEDQSTLVCVSKSDFPNLAHDSVINCNNIYQINLKELIEKVKNGGKIFSHKLPKTVLDALISGVLKSNQVAPDIKQKLI
jgi:hypothetical protein